MKTLLGAEGVHQVRRAGRLGAVGEVEDARRLVREHETDAGQSVHGACGDADDDERQQVLHYSARRCGHAGCVVPADVYVLSFISSHRTGERPFVESFLR